MKLEKEALSSKVRLPGLFEGVRVTWFTGNGDIHGSIMAVYSDATIDVESDSGNQFINWPFSTVRLYK